MSAAAIIDSQQPGVAAPDSKPGKRLVELDILRGFLLLWMTLTHLPTKASLVSNQTFGFVSGAEGFIFLSAFILAQLEHRRAARSGEPAVLRDVTRRSLRVYVYHCALIAIAFLVFAPLAKAFDRAAVQNLLSFFLADPRHAIAAAALLVYRPSLFDILPMYILFLPLTAAAMAAANRWGWSSVVGTSVGLWLCAQFGLRHFLYARTDAFGLHVPETSTGAFDLWAWQMLWIVGLALGTAYARRQDGFHPKRWIVIASALLVVIFAILRYSPVDQWMSPDLYGHLIDKWHLGPVRVLNFTAMTVVLVRYGCWVANLPVFRPLVLLGQASIEVFCMHILCCLVGDSLSHAADPNLPALTQIILLTGSLAALFLTGWAKRRTPQATQRPSPPTR